MTAHTPGPWKVEGRAAVSAHHNAGDPRMEFWICEEINGDRRPGATTGRPIDNARLIAAAPELLEAVQLALLQNSHDMLLTGEELRLLQAVVTKATGGAA